jgi:3D (Asp-Asp-Asp) domain-containing protein
MNVQNGQEVRSILYAARKPAILPSREGTYAAMATLVGGGDIKGDHIDLFFPSHNEAREWGRQYKRALIWYR